LVDSARRSTEYDLFAMESGKQGPGGGEEIGFHLELSPEQLKITHTALRALLDDFGHEEAAVHRIIHEVLDKLPDEHSIRAIELGER
jgi:hypothetical protein